MTTFIGKNDIGKSTVLDALEIFFNNEAIKIDSNDCNIHSGNAQVTIACDFIELPSQLVLDSGEDVYIVANHLTAVGLNDLLLLKETELQKRIREKGLNRDCLEIPNNYAIS